MGYPAGAAPPAMSQGAPEGAGASPHPGPEPRDADPRSGGMPAAGQPQADGNGAPPGSSAAGSPGPAGTPARARLEHLPYWIVLAGAAFALATIRQGVHYVKGGTLVLAGVLLLAAAARLFLPDRRAGMLSSRRRLLDVAALAALGLGLLVAGLVLPAPS